MVTTQVLADPDPAALAATKGDYTTAAQLWRERAQQGDAAAEFNLGVLYRAGKGVPQNLRMANQWFRKAAQQGLVDAYNTLSPPGGAQPVSADRHASAVLDPATWVGEQDPDDYTLQLASSRNVKLIEKYITDNHLQGHAGYYRKMRGGVVWYSLVYGAYPSAAQARAAIASLPAPLRKWSPLVRKYADIRRSMVQ